MWLCPIDVVGQRLGQACLIFCDVTTKSISRLHGPSVDYAIAAFRAVIGFLFFCHGASTLFAWPTAPHGGHTAAVGAWPSWWGAVIQLVCGAALFLGLGTRIAAFIASGSMAYAYFWSHQPDGVLPIQNNGELSAIFCWALFLMIFLGAGALSLDRLIARGGRTAQSDDGDDGTAGE
ncbi:MAG: DoxX family protein, partial [Rhodococcus sp. (in: high G+C Gram-positive bacteria)]